MPFKDPEQRRKAVRDSKKKAKGLPDNGNPLMETPRRGVTQNRKPQETPNMETPMVTPETPDVGAQIVNALRMVNARLADLEAWRDSMLPRMSQPTVPPPSVSNVAASARVARRYPIMIKGNRVTVTEGQAYSCYGVQGIAPWLDEDNQPIPE